MMKPIDYLEHLDFSEIEAKLYLTLLETGAISVRTLAQMLGIPRTTVYNYMDHLVDKGLVMKLVSGSQTLLAANAPDDILPYLVEQKVQVGKMVQEGLPQILETLSKNKKAVNEAEIKYYKGKLGVKKIYEDALKAKDLRSYVNITEIEKVFPENKRLFDDAIKQNTEMRIFEIVEDSPEARSRFETTDRIERYSYKFLPKDMRLSAQDILIYDNKVAIIHFKDKIDGVIHSDTDLYNNFKILFDYVWQTLPHDTVKQKQQE